MHVQKNVFDSIIGILLDVKGKTKEGLNSRLDLVNLGIRQELLPIPQPNGKYLLPAASYNLNPEEKHAICVAEDFESSIWILLQHQESCVNERPYTHQLDCHVMLTTFLPIAIRTIRPVFVKMAITRLCCLFNKIS